MWTYQRSMLITSCPTWHLPTFAASGFRSVIKNRGPNWMRILLGMISALLAIYGGEWVYRSFLRSTDQPTSTLRAVAAHFGVSGVHGTYYPVRHGFRHSSVTAVIAYKMDNHPIAFAVVECPSEVA